MKTIVLTVICLLCIVSGVGAQEIEGPPNLTGPIPTFSTIPLCDEECMNALTNGTGSAPIECVPKQEVIATLKSLLSKSEPDTSGVIHTVCNTCNCWHRIGTAEYYECLAAKTRKQDEYFADIHKLIKRIEENPICD